MSSRPSHRLYLRHCFKYVGRRTYTHPRPCRCADGKHVAVLAAIEPDAWIGHHGPRSSSPNERVLYTTGY